MKNPHNINEDVINDFFSHRTVKGLEMIITEHSHKKL